MATTLYVYEMVSRKLEAIINADNIDEALWFYHENFDARYNWTPQKTGLKENIENLVTITVNKKGARIHENN